MKKINDLNNSNFTGIWQEYIKDHLNSGKKWVLFYDKNWIKLFYHSLDMGYSILEIDWVETEEEALEIFENIIKINDDKLKFPAYVWNIEKDGKYYVILRLDNVWDHVIFFRWKLLKLATK